MKGERACAGQLETKSGLCPDDIPLRGTKSTLRVDEICELVLADDEPGGRDRAAQINQSIVKFGGYM